MESSFALLESELALYQSNEETNAEQLVQQIKYANHILSDKRAWADSIHAKWNSMRSSFNYNSSFSISKSTKVYNARSCKEFFFTAEQYIKASNLSELLAPIRIDVEIEGIRIKDSLSWNVHDTSIPISVFTDNLLEDYRIPTNLRSQFHAAISLSINSQIQDAQAHFPSALQNTTFDLPELRIPIKINVIVGDVSVIDQFDWDINCTANNPEAFASQLVSDLKVSQEFVAAIAHSIREQIHAYAKSLLLIDYKFEGGTTIIEDEELANSFLPVNNPNTRREMLGPFVNQVDFKEVDRLEAEQEKYNKRKKRLDKRVRKANALLPDREPKKSHFTKVPSKNDPDPVPIFRPTLDNLSDDDLPAQRGASKRAYSAMKGTEYKPSHANHSVNSVKNEAKKLDRQVLGSNDWRCMKCGVSSHETPMKRPGPQGNDTLCNSCGIEYMS